MTAYLRNLRVNLSKVRQEGMTVDVLPQEHRHPRALNMPNVTAAVAAYEASDKSWGTLTRIALEFNTSPSSIAGRIGRANGRYDKCGRAGFGVKRQRELTPGNAPSASHSS